MPHIKSVSTYAQKNAEYRKQLEETYQKLPYRVHAGVGRLTEKRIKEDLLSLKRSGITVADMSRLLGVSRSLINNSLKSGQIKTKGILGAVGSDDKKRYPAKLQQGGVFIKSKFMHNRKQFPACTYYRNIGEDALDDYDTV